MRIPLVAGNWKMNRTIEEARHLVIELVPELQKIEGVEKVLCPPATAILAVSAMLAGTGISLGAQNMHWESSGAYTGEISPGMVAELCKYVIIGHSERRAYFGETDDMVNRKSQAALANGLIPIICVGETLAENESGRTSSVVQRQIDQGLKSIRKEQASGLVIAYEPVWAIGTGRAATGEGANQVIGGVIRSILADLFGSGVAANVRILYGGSVTGSNAAEFFYQPEIDGALVGGASLKPLDFIQITRAAAK